MGIKEEIKQSKFASSHEKAVINLIYTSNWLRDIQKNFFVNYGIKGQHYNILRILKGKDPDPLSPGEIKDVMLDKSPDITRLLDKMVGMDLITRELCPENRRKMDVRITKKGVKLIQEIRNNDHKLMEKWQTNLTAKESDQLSELLDKLRG